ncbi:beta-N-acetylhexosaminidase [Maribellus mangrovi]|uniref:beta-N-acetylhexosaminidase n=1 Tax=Maribellus mangrovi TaxID=3133146 RepID=UPI0030EEBE53
MRGKVLFVIFIFQVLLANGQSIQIIPSPANCELKNGSFLHVKSWVVQCENGSEKVFNQFADQIKNIGIDLPFQKGTGKFVNLYLRCAQEDLEGEEYRISVDSDKTIIESSDEVGMFYALQTLVQLAGIKTAENNKIKIPESTIIDKPRFGWRGFMLDESRHFFGKEKVKQLLDWMAFYKLNVFHWHLTDVQGWRIEIKKFPLLTEVGGVGNYSNPDGPAQYYTQEDIKEIVQYASERFIEVIPEIDMPGHATAANKAYPEYSGGGSERWPEFTFNPGNENTYKFLTDILREVTELFPSQYIHLGGDEVHFGNEQWKTDSLVQVLMKKHEFENLTQVEFYFITRMADSVSSLNKTLIGWDEIISAGVSPEQCRVMWWRHNKPEQLMQGLKSGYKTIMCPRIPFYFDFVQDSTHTSGRRWKGDFVTLASILDFSKTYRNPLNQYPSLIAGVQANLWSERIHSDERLDFMTFPRIAALAEIAWTDKPKVDYKEFVFRLQPFLQLYKKQGISYFNPENRDETPEVKGIVP